MPLASWIALEDERFQACTPRVVPLGVGIPSGLH